MHSFAGGIASGAGVMRLVVVIIGVCLALAAQAQSSPQAATGQSSAVQTGQSGAAASPTAETGKPSGAAQDTTKQPAAANGVVVGAPVQANALHAQREAAKLYLAGVKLIDKKEPEAAWKLMKQAAELEPGNPTYARAAEVARQSAVAQLVQEASRERNQGSGGDAALLLQRAMEIDPKNPLVLQHTDELAQDASATEPAVLSNMQTPALAGPIALEPKQEKHSFHLHNNERQVVEEVFRAYGIDASIHDSVQNQRVRLDVDDVTFAAAAKVLSLVTKTFWEPLDPHRVLVAQDTRENRVQFQRTAMETVYLSGLTDKELTDVSNLARNVFDAQQAVVEPTRDTLTVRAPARTLAAFNATLGSIEAGQNQVDLNVKVIQLAHISNRETGMTFFQQTSVYNAFSAVNSVIQQNQAAVQEIISQGLVPDANTLAHQIEIIAILLASGQLSGTPFNQGFATFGGGLTESLLVPGPATLTMSLNSSDTRTLDDIHLRLSDEEAGTFKIGERYPITTSSYSSVALPSIPGFNTTAAALQAQTVPQIQYEDLGLTLKATPKVMRSNDVALNLEMKIESLGGSSLNDIPVLNSQQFTGVLTLRAGETAVLLSDLTLQESRALSGLPGVGDIPGLQDISDVARGRNVARLLILVTPSVIRGPQSNGHGPRLMVDKGTAAH
jgi:general secretion pathway protein D